MSRSNYIFTSESVSEGHPDKVADRISDTVVDAFLAAEPEARVACETLQDFLLTPEGIELASVFPKIAKGRVRRKILDLVRAMAGEPDAGDI